MKMNTIEALDKYGINFDMYKSPVHVFDAGRDTMVQVPNVNAMMRTDTLEILEGVSVTDSYRVIQTREYADIIEKVCGAFEADFVKGGLLKDGKMTYLQCELPDSIRVKGTDDIINKYLTFINSFDGTSKFLVLPTGKRVFCENQMNMLLKEAKAKGLCFSHTKNVGERLKMADQAILDVMNAYKVFGEKCDVLASTPFSDAQMELATRKLFKVPQDATEDDIATRTKNNMDTVRELFTDGLGLENWRGTAWAAYNAMTEYADHHRALRKTTDRFENALVGTGAIFKNQALNVVEFAIQYPPLVTVAVN